MPGVSPRCVSSPTAWPASTLPLAKKPTYITITSSSGMIAPFTPNCARDWIICGRPSFGPCAECRAITAPPSRLPTARPTTDQKAPPPKTTASAPVTTAVIWRFAPSQRVNWEKAVPCRSLSGTTSMDRTSTRPAMVQLPFFVIPCCRAQSFATSSGSFLSLSTSRLSSVSCSVVRTAPSRASALRTRESALRSAISGTTC